MNPTYESHELMDRYLDGKLNADDVVRFEQRLKTDPEFAEQFEVHKITNQVIVGHELMSLKTRMQKDLSASVGISSWKIWAGIGSALVLAFILWKSFPVTPEPTEKLPNPADTIKQKSATPIDTTRVVEKESPTTVSGKTEILCSDSLIVFSCQTRGTCLDAQEGAIEIDVNTVKSGTAPYSYSISMNGEFHTRPSIEGLAPGRYYIFVKDSKQCIRKLKNPVDVSAVDCR